MSANIGRGMVPVALTTVIIAMVLVIMTFVIGVRLSDGGYGNDTEYSGSGTYYDGSPVGCTGTAVCSRVNESASGHQYYFDITAECGTVSVAFGQFLFFDGNDSPEPGMYTRSGTEDTEYGKCSVWYCDHESYRYSFYVGEKCRVHMIKLDYIGEESTNPHLVSLILTQKTSE